MKETKLIVGMLVALVVLMLAISPFSSVPVSQAADPTATPAPSPTPAPPAKTPYVHLPLSADIEKVGSPPQVKVKASVELPGAGFEVAWGQMVRRGNSFAADIKIWVTDAGAAQSATTFTHEYVLGDPPAGQYLVVLRAWGRIVAAEIIRLTVAEGSAPPPSPTPKLTPIPPGVLPVPPVITATGKLVKLGVTAFQYGTHGLLKEGKLVLALKSSTVNLDLYVDKEVVVWGHLVHPGASGGLPLPPMPVITLYGVSDVPQGLDGGPPLLNVVKIALKNAIPNPTPRPTPTPHPTMTPRPTGTPHPTPIIRGTAVVVGSASLAAGKSARIPVIVKNITAAGGLGAYDLRIGFNPAVIRVDDVVGGAAPFDTVAAKNINNTTGHIALNGFHALTPGPKGDIIIANLVVTAVATQLSTTPLNLTIVTLADTSGATISAVAIKGWVNVLASSAEAVVRLVPGIGQDGIAVINLRVDKVRNALTNADVAPANVVKRFNGQANFNPDRITVVGVRGTGSFNNPVADIRNDVGAVGLGGSQNAGGALGPVVLAQLIARITGSSLDSHIVNLDLDPIDDGTSDNIAYDIPPGIALRRGDAKADGKIDIADALFIAQYLVGTRLTGDRDNEVHAVNGASVRPDGESGDKLTITDALFVAQYLAGLRDDSFEPVA